MMAADGGLLLASPRRWALYLVDPGLTLAINFAFFLLVLLVRPRACSAVAEGRSRAGGSPRRRPELPSRRPAAAAVAYTVSLLISILAYASSPRRGRPFRARPATSRWRRRRSSHRHLHLALLSDHLPLAAVLAIAPVIGFVIALGVGLSTLRLSGVYFVIFTFGLAELTSSS